MIGYDSLRFICSSTSKIQHIPVLKNKILEIFNTTIKSNTNNNNNKYFIDGTIGCGGHSDFILSNIPNSYILGIDRDKEIIQIAKKRLLKYEDRIKIVHGCYSDIKKFINSENFPTKVDGILLDLGANSIHFDDSTRGFSFRLNGPLDMRFDNNNNNELTAEIIVNTWSETALHKLFKTYGETNLAYEYAKAIVKYRNRGENKIRTTHELRDIIYNIYIKWNKKKIKNKIHPATTCFQALRIVVNDELNHVQKGMVEAMDCLKDNGRLGIITFHSLEDGPVKKYFKLLEQEKKYKIITKKVTKPSKEELDMNPRSRSAKLRVIEKIE